STASALGEARADLSSWGLDPDSLVRKYYADLKSPWLLDSVSDETSGPAGPPQPPARVRDLTFGGMDVFEKFDSGDAGLKHVEKVVRDAGGATVWNNHRAAVRAIFSDDALRPRLTALSHGDSPLVHVIDVGGDRTLTIELRLGAPEFSHLEFKEEIDK